MRTLLLLSSFLVLIPHAQAGPFLDRQRRYPRVRDAQAAQGTAVRAAFQEAGAAWPPRRLFVRAFKQEGVVELWSAAPKGRALVHVRDFPVCMRSGELGPKVRQGDGQVPEGFYTIDRFNPRSSFHLSLGLSYPNAVDRARTPPGASPGGDIFVHGSCVTIGCLPLRDTPMEALYLAAIAARDNGQRRIPVHAFPCRMDAVSCHLAMANATLTNPALGNFWGEQLLPAYLAFERTRVVPRVRIHRGRYLLQTRRARKSGSRPASIFLTSRRTVRFPTKAATRVAPGSLRRAASNPPTTTRVGTTACRQRRFGICSPPATSSPLNAQVRPS